MRGLIVFFLMLPAMPLAHADVFERIRPADTVLREALKEDQADYYFRTPGIDQIWPQEKVSEVKALAVEGMTRPSALRDLDAAFDKYLIKNLRQDKDYQSYVSLRHPLLLLEYSSPVTADVLKHYRMAAYERLVMESARLSEVERGAEGPAERLSRQSERECLKANQGLGLVEAMRVCQKSVRPFDALTSLDGTVSLSDGRRRIHVVAQALGRLGLDKKHIDQVIGITGDRVLSEDSYKDVFPAKTFLQGFNEARASKARRWREALAKFRATGKGTTAALEELSWPGVPVTARTLAGVDLLAHVPQGIMILKLADAGAFAEVDGLYLQADEYLNYCLADPALSSEFRQIVRDKQQALAYVRMVARADRSDVLVYKELIAALAAHADTARTALARRPVSLLAPETSADIKEMMLNF